MEDARLLGRLALHYKLITKDQLVDALEQQNRESVRRRLGEILIERGDVTAKQFEQLLAAQTQYLDKLTRKETEARESAEAAASSVGERGTEPVSMPAQADWPAAPTAASDGEAGLLGSLLATAAAQGASDLHLHSGRPPAMRCRGDLVGLPGIVLTAEQCSQFVGQLLSPNQRDQLEETGQVDFSKTWPGVGRLRGNAFRQHAGTDVVLRLIPPEVPSLLDLGLPADLARLANFRQGLVLLTGPTGCGKTSSLAALVRILNEERRDHVITVEDPVEFLHRPMRCVINQRQVGRDTESFARALRGALREDPDVIVIGELRDLETISLALTAAETGHLVLASMHTTNSMATINRIIGAFPPEQQPQVRMMVSESLRAVVSQRLVPRADGSGRVPALEILWCNRAVSNLIREQKVYQLRSVLQTGSSQGMCLLDSSPRGARGRRNDSARRRSSGRRSTPAVRGGGVAPMAKINELFRYTRDKGGSDLHLVSGLEPRLRVHGGLDSVEGWTSLDDASLRALLIEIASEAQWREFEVTGDLDFAYGLEGIGRFRANYLRQEHGVSAVFRLIPEQIIPLEDLALPKVLERLALLERGLVLVTGPTGSGKSTTLAAIVDRINRTLSRHIVTIEDPIEFVHTPRRCFFSQREVGRDTDSFGSALRAAMRQDADVVLVGEMRDLETIALAITAAEMGALVFGTLHTSGAANTIDRLVDAFPSDQQSQVRTTLAESLVAVVSQILLKTADGAGRAAANEILLKTPALPNIIREGNTPMLRTLIQGGRKDGMQLMDDALLALVEAGRVSPRDAYLKAEEKKRFEGFLGE